MRKEPERGVKGNSVSITEYILNDFSRLTNLWTVISEHFKRMIHRLYELSMQLHQPLLAVPPMVRLSDTRGP